MRVGVLDVQLLSCAASCSATDVGATRHYYARRQHVAAALVLQRRSPNRAVRNSNNQMA